MFALDSIIRKAVQTAITILVPGQKYLTTLQIFRVWYFQLLFIYHL